MFKIVLVFYSSFTSPPTWAEVKERVEHTSTPPMGLCGLLQGDLYLYLLTYLLTPCGRVLLEKLTGSAASQDIPRIFGT